MFSFAFCFLFCDPEADFCKRLEACLEWFIIVLITSARVHPCRPPSLGVACDVEALLLLATLFHAALPLLLLVHGTTRHISLGPEEVPNAT